MVTPSPATKNPMARVVESANSGDLVIVIGTGISLALTNNENSILSWKGLIRNGFEYGVRKGLITNKQAQNWKVQIDSADMDDVLCAAEFMGRKLGAPSGDLYAHWLEQAFKDVHPANNRMADAIIALSKRGIPLCTLNYDHLLERVTELPAVNLSEVARAMRWMRREVPGILHIHGSWDAPETCILGIRDYETTISSATRELVQRTLSAFRRMLFIGCGDTFADPNFSALITWLRANLRGAIDEHYALVTNSQVPQRDADPKWSGFVEPLGFGPEYTDLAEFLLSHFPPPKAPIQKGEKGGSRRRSSSEQQETLLADYRSFLLRDCGQMTIEGVRADMDIGQRKFDIERLFVPLHVLACPPLAGC